MVKPAGLQPPCSREPGGCTAFRSDSNSSRPTHPARALQVPEPGPMDMLGSQVRLTAAIPMENPYCSCKLTRPAGLADHLQRLKVLELHVTQTQTRDAAAMSRAALLSLKHPCHSTFPPPRLLREVRCDHSTPKRPAVSILADSWSTTVGFRV